MCSIVGRSTKRTRRRGVAEGWKRRRIRVFHPGNKSPPLSPYFSALLFILRLRNCNDRRNDDNNNTFKSGRKKKRKRRREKNNEGSFTVRVFSPIIIAREKERKRERKTANAAYRSFLSFVVVRGPDRIFCVASRHLFISRQWIVNHTSVHAFCAESTKISLSFSNDLRLSPPSSSNITRLRIFRTFPVDKSLAGSM